MTDAEGLLLLAERVARQAGRVVAAGRHGDVEVTRTKSSPTDVVTAVDLAAEQVIRQQILAARPGDGFIGEEGEDVEGSSGVRWVADPIDGTVNYLYGIPQYAVSLAAELDGEVVAGVVHNAATGETFTASRGHGAQLDGRPVVASACTDLASALLGIGYGYRADARAAQAVEVSRLVAQVRDVRRLGSAALDLCFVACGRLDAYVERGLKRWDLAAGGLVAREAGARVEGLDGEAASELLVVAAPEPLFERFHGLLVASGFGEWPR
jgi:myo-inositol-1(or 4)-monophosphatase